MFLIGNGCVLEHVPAIVEPDQEHADVSGEGECHFSEVCRRVGGGPTGSSLEHSEGGDGAHDSFSKSSFDLLEVFLCVSVLQECRRDRACIGVEMKERSCNFLHMDDERRAFCRDSPLVEIPRTFVGILHVLSLFLGEVSGCLFEERGDERHAQ